MTKEFTRAHDILTEEELDLACRISAEIMFPLLHDGALEFNPHDRAPSYALGKPGELTPEGAKGQPGMPLCDVQRVIATDTDGERWEVEDVDQMQWEIFRCSKGYEIDVTDPYFKRDAVAAVAMWFTTISINTVAKSGVQIFIAWD